MASSSSTPSQRKIEYDVFLSFRGDDTRKNIVDYLYRNLKKKSIRTFKDDVELKKGQCVPKLLDIIKQTRFAIVLFSKDYASSKWCLEEIATIMECQQQYGEEIMIPIFYDVEPSVVRNQTESFAESFKRHEGKENTEKLERWKKALKDAGEISGYHLQNDFNGYLAECCETVTADMFTRVNQSSTDLEENNFVGLKSRVEDVAKLLRQEPDKVEFIGIWGMRGIGKTTIAMTLFNKYKYFNQFEGAACVEEIAANQRNITNLQKHLLNTILQQNVEISNALDGNTMMKRMLQTKKVLIVLDDVDHPNKLKNLAGCRTWFGGGSRVIITTTDERVLRSHGVDNEYIYKVNKLDNEEAIELFCLKAFQMKIPKTGFDKLCRSIVHYAMGLPLALELLGSHLHREDTVYWESILDELKDPDSHYGPKDEIDKVLKISYEGLDPKNKNMFLHIACFFKNWNDEYVENVLGSNLQMLIAKSFISVQNGRIEMHGLIQEMGWRIARKENPRKRVWQFKDVEDVVCRTDQDHHHIEGMSWWEWDPENIKCTFKVNLKRMKNLKMLKVGGDGVNVFRRKINYLPRNLRWLECEFYHFTSLPQRFELPQLVGLSLRKSSLSDCNFTEELGKLIILDLSSSFRLLRTPDFDKMPNLKKLNLSSCKQLEEIHSSIGNLRKLVFLNLSECSNLKELPSFNQDSRLVELDLRGVGIIEVPSWIQQLDVLTKLSLDDCEHLASLPNDLCELENLKILSIKNCRNLKSLPENLEGLSSLEYLNLQRSHFDSFPESFSRLASLQYLDITECQNPNKLPKLPANIRELYADCRFKIALAIECSELYSVSYSDDNNAEVGTFLSEEFIHRETPLLVSYLITAAEDNKLKMNQMLRSFKYRRYQSNGISIHLNSPWYSQKFVGFVVCFLSLEGDIWGPHSYQDIDQSMKHCTVRVKFSHKDSENEFLPTNYVMAGLASENEDVKGHVCFAFLPVRSLWDKSKAIKDYSRFEVQFMNLKASADWGCSLLYQRQTGASEQISRHNGSDSGLTTDDIACLTLSELEETEYLNLNRLNSAHYLNCSQLHRLRYIDISGCERLKMRPTLPATIWEVYAHSNLASENIIDELATKYSELYSVSFSRKNNKAELNLSAEKLARNFAHLPSQSRNSPFVVTYPTLTDIDTKGWFKYQSHPSSNKVSINLNPSWYSQTFVGFVVHFLLKGRLHGWESHPNVRPFRHCKLIAKLIHKDNANEVLQTNCVISRLYDEEFDFNKDEFMICFAYIPFCSPSSVSPNDYSVFEVAFLDSNNSSDWSCGLLYKNDVCEAIRSNASSSSEHRDEETSMTEHRIKEASMAFTQPEAIIGKSIQSVHNHPIDEDCEIQQEPGPDRIKSQLIEIVDPHKCRMVSMPEPSDAKVVRLLYTNSGVGILALISSDDIPKLWKWSLNDEQNTSVKATANFISQHWQPNSGLLMNVSGLDLKKIVPCIGLFKDDSCVVSAVGGMVSLFNINTFNTLKALTTFWLPTPTFLVSHPHKKNIIAIGTEDATIYIYDVDVDEVKFELIKAHHKHITGLAFSTTVTADNKYMLVSSSADAQLCVWDIDGRWQKRRSIRIQLPAGYGEVHSGDIHVMFHIDQVQLLLTHETQLEIYDTSTMERKRQWIPHGCLSARISYATYSCNSKLVYASFIDGNIGVLDANNLTLRCRIAPSAYLSPLILNRSVYAVVIAAHPQEPNQLALGLTNGSVKVIAPLESEGEWGISLSTGIKIVNVDEEEGQDEQRKKAPLNKDKTPNPIRCFLCTTYGDTKIKVARGMIYNNLPLLPNYAMVLVDEIVQGKEMYLLPMPTQYHTRLGQIIGTIIQWPMHLVCIGEEDIIINSRKQNKGKNKHGELLVTKDRIEDCIKLEPDYDIFHHSCPVFVMVDNIMDLLSMEWLDASIIQVFIMYLHWLCKESRVNSIGFMCPTKIAKAYVDMNVDNVIAYVGSTMANLRDKTFILAPYHQVNHWLLLVICTSSRMVYVLDPMQYKRDIEIKPTLNKVFQTYANQWGQQTGHFVIGWKNIQCPQQPGSKECGYYVMRYMYEICTTYSAYTSFDEAFQEIEPYSKEKIDEIRTMWENFFTLRHSAESPIDISDDGSKPSEHGDFGKEGESIDCDEDVDEYESDAGHSSGAAMANHRGEMQSNEVRGIRVETCIGSPPTKKRTHGLSLNVPFDGAAHGVEVAMSNYNDSVNEKGKEREDEQRKKQMWDNFNWLLASFPLDEEYIKLEIDQTIFHHTDTCSTFMLINDIKDMMKMDFIDASIIKLFILFLNRLCNQFQVTSIGFVCPVRISMNEVKQNVPDITDITTYLTHVMEQHKNKQFILAPYLQEFHWLLLVICIRSKSIYVLDPLPHNRTIGIKNSLNRALHSVSTNERNINWKQCKCPIQPGGVECGYYVMRYMFDIVTKYSSFECLDEAFESNNQYSINEINEIRALWAKSFLEECM